jgi:endonuclease YncB( thermonuclease family)
MAMTMDERRRARRRRMGLDRPERPLAGRQRRLSRLMLVFGFAIVLAVFGTAGLQRWGDGSTGGTTVAGPRVSRSGDTLRHSLPDSLPLARVSSVIDGDTLDVAVDGDVQRVRLFGINAPEIGATCADEATAHLTQLAGGFVRLMTDERLEDPGGRQLRYVFTVDGESIDARLISDGVVRAWRLDGVLLPELVALEEGAQAAGRGCLWERR